MRVNPLAGSLFICGLMLAAVPLSGNAQFASNVTPGPAGTPGSVFYMIPNAPTPALGATTDAAMDTNTYNIYSKIGSTWTLEGNIKGPTGATGPAGPTGGFTAYGQPTTRTFALATAYQCTDTTKPCVFTITLTSTANLTLTAGTSNTADIVVGTTAGIASSGGVTIAKYSNTLTGTLVVGLALNTNSNASYTINMPAAGYMAIRQTSGTVTVVNSSTEQTVS